MPLASHPVLWHQILNAFCFQVISFAPIIFLTASNVLTRKQEDANKSTHFICRCDKVNIVPHMPCVPLCLTGHEIEHVWCEKLFKWLGRCQFRKFSSQL